MRWRSISPIGSKTNSSTVLGMCAGARLPDAALHSPFQLKLCESTSSVGVTAFRLLAILAILSVSSFVPSSEEPCWTTTGQRVCAISLQNLECHDFAMPAPATTMEFLVVFGGGLSPDQTKKCFARGDGNFDSLHDTRFQVREGWQISLFVCPAARRYTFLRCNP